MLQAGNFALRVTNAGILGNTFFNIGRCFDPSFEYPRGSGHEALGHAELWVGAVTPQGRARASGGPMLEWRPTLAPDDRVRTAWAGNAGTKRDFDDDGDGRLDEELLNGVDDDGDGRIDEDLGVVADETMTADYRDDQPEAVNYLYANGEAHEPLHLAVHQETYAWAAPGYDGIAGLHFRITNVGRDRLTALYVGLFCDLDSRGRTESAGHLDDVVTGRSYSLVIPTGDVRVGSCFKHCAERFSGTAPAVADAGSASGLPIVAVLGLSHTTDPLARLRDYGLPDEHEAMAGARAPGKDTTFRYVVYAQNLPPWQGGPPLVDADRYSALAGRYPGTTVDLQVRQDWSVLLTCGPFPTLGPGESIDVEAALVAASSEPELDEALARAVLLYQGRRRNLIPDGRLGDWSDGIGGINGHETCLTAPPGVRFEYYPHCLEKFVQDPGCQPPVGDPVPPYDALPPTEYAPGSCIWTDLDCDVCTGADGAETVVPWLDIGSIPPTPGQRVFSGNHRVTVLWDDEPEIRLRAGMACDSGFTFASYRLYRLAKWSRVTVLPPPSQWEMVAEFQPVPHDMSEPLAAYTDSTVLADRMEYGQAHHPVGRYRYIDPKVQNGFDYLYTVTTLAERSAPPGGVPLPEQRESPIIAVLDSVVTPHFAADDLTTHVWVVPNPYRAHAAWDRPPVPGDPFRRHVDFCGLPRSPAAIGIYTVAGDLVTRLDHDGTNGDGQASWNLITRNGQEAESGIYLFTVDSRLGHFVGKFVVIR